MSDTEYEDWQRSVPDAIRGDLLWQLTAYRRGLFLADLAWGDVRPLLGEPLARSLADQLVRSAGSISANIAEGYGRSSHRDRTRFYEYALGSSRETRDWYYKLRHSLGDPLVSARIELLTTITRLLLGLISAQRRSEIREDSPVYYVPGEDG